MALFNFSQGLSVFLDLFQNIPFVKVILHRKKNPKLCSTVRPYHRMKSGAFGHWKRYLLLSKHWEKACDIATTFLKLHNYQIEDKQSKLGFDAFKHKWQNWETYIGPKKCKNIQLCIWAVEIKAVECWTHWQLSWFREIKSNLW